MTSEVLAVTFDVTVGGRHVSGLHFVNQCFSDRSAGMGVRASIPIHTTYRPKRRKGSEHRPKPRPLRQPTFSYGGGKAAVAEHVADAERDGHGGNDPDETISAMAQDPRTATVSRVAIRLSATSPPGLRIPWIYISVCR